MLPLVPHRNPSAVELLPTVDIISTIFRIPRSSFGQQDAKAVVASVCRSRCIQTSKSATEGESIKASDSCTHTVAHDARALAGGRKILKFNIFCLNATNERNAFVDL